jgi:hypothetical protein
VAEDQEPSESDRLRVENGLSQIAEAVAYSLSVVVAYSEAPPGVLAKPQAA